MKEKLIKHIDNKIKKCYSDIDSGKIGREGKLFIKGKIEAFKTIRNYVNELHKKTI